jgi:spore maturation protein CgeB
MGTYSEDRQPSLDRLLLETASQARDRKFAVAGSLYPAEIQWPENVERINHLSPAEHRDFYNSQEYTLNLTRRQMIRAGYSPSVRIFEAAACGTPIITDRWPGLGDFFIPGKEILVADSCEQVLSILRNLDELENRAIAERARAITLAHHTGANRAEQLEKYYEEAVQCQSDTRKSSQFATRE